MEQLQKTKSGLLARYGDTAAFLLRFGPQAQYSCVCNLDKSAEAPLVIELINAYGEDVIIQLVTNHVAEFYLFVKADYTALEILQTARLLVSIDSFRLMNIAFALGFFWAIKTGEYELYGAEPIRVLSAFRRYATKALSRQHAIIDKEERRRKAEEEAKHYELVRHEQELIKQGKMQPHKPIDYDSLCRKVDKYLT